MQVKELAEKLKEAASKTDLVFPEFPIPDNWADLSEALRKSPHYGHQTDKLYEALARVALEFYEERYKDLEEFRVAVMRHPCYSDIRQNIRVATAEIAFLNIPPYKPEEPK